jgi:hypothetical protein
MKIYFKTTVAVSFLVCFFSASAQRMKNFGAKAGLNFIDVNTASQVNFSNKKGLVTGFFFAPPSKKLISYQSEILYSAQGYGFNTTTSTGRVYTDYILLPQLTTLRLSKFAQLQAGMQLSVLIYASADSLSHNPSSVPNFVRYDNVSDYFNRVTYGFAAGVELKPFKGLLIGTRLNVDMSSATKQPSNGIVPDYIPRNKEQLKSNVLQLYLGYKF